MLGLCCCLGFSLVVASGGHSSFWCPRLLLQWLLFSWGMGSARVRASVVAARELSGCSSLVLEHRLSSCGTWAYMWDLPGPGIKPMSPALAGGKALIWRVWEPQKLLRGCYLVWSWIDSSLSRSSTCDALGSFSYAWCAALQAGEITSVCIAILAGIFSFSVTQMQPHKGL